MTIIPKEQIDAENALRLEFSKAETETIERVLELQKDNPEFTPTEESIQSDATLKELVEKATEAGIKVNTKFDLAESFQRYQESKKQESEINEQKIEK